MNEITSFTEKDLRDTFMNIIALVDGKSEDNNNNANTKFIDAIERETGIKVDKDAEMIFGTCSRYSSSKEKTKKPFYHYAFFRSEESPNIYKLGGDSTTFDSQELRFNECLPKVEIEDNKEHMKKFDLSRELMKNPLKNPLNYSELPQEGRVTKISDLLENCIAKCSVDYEVFSTSEPQSQTVEYAVFPTSEPQSQQTVPTVKEPQSQPEPPSEPKPKPPAPPKWKKYTDKDGDAYYYNLVTKKSQWDRPTEFEE